MMEQRSWRGRLPVALTAVAAAVCTVLAGGAAQAAEPAPDAGTMGRAAQSRVADLHGQTSLFAKQKATNELTFGDLDGDAKADLAAVDSSGRLWVYPGKALVYSGSGPRPESYFSARFQAGSGWGDFTALVRHGDWNNDGKQDLLARDGVGRLFFYAGTGTRPGIVRNGIQIGTAWDTFLDIVGVGDRNGDGFDDLMGRLPDGTLRIYNGTGDISKPFRSSTVSGGTGWNGNLLTTIGDWNGDGHTEFLFRNTSDDVLLYWGSSSGFPSNGPETIINAEEGPFVRNLVGMGNLTSDAVFDGKPVRQPLPDVIAHEGGTLVLLAADADDDLAAFVGSGFSGYHLF